MRLILSISLLCFSLFAQAKEIQTHAKVCPHPAKTCHSEAYDFEANELSFALPAQLEWQSGYYSADFYAVILRSIKAIPVQDIHGDEVCKGFIEEPDRLAVQAKFPEHKVFTSRNGCATRVFYTNTNEKYNFIAVYAGENKNEGSQILEQAKQLGFTDASLRKIQVIFDNGD